MEVSRRYAAELEMDNTRLQTQIKAAQSMMQQFAAGVAMGRGLDSGSSSASAARMPPMFTPMPGGNSLNFG